MFWEFCQNWPVSQSTSFHCVSCLLTVQQSSTMFSPCSWWRRQPLTIRRGTRWCTGSCGPPPWRRWDGCRWGRCRPGPTGCTPPAGTGSGSHRPLLIWVTWRFWRWGSAPSSLLGNQLFSNLSSCKLKASDCCFLWQAGWRPNTEPSRNEEIHMLLQVSVKSFSGLHQV